MEEGGVRQMRMARVGDVVLLDYPADSTGPRSINCYLVKTLDFTAAAFGGADAKRLKVGPDRLLYSLRWKHNAPVFISARVRSVLFRRWLEYPASA
jgi:hypothetical protein